ncbi:RHS repeat-associated core domain-containing protein [Aphanothece stagnina]|uniref:RHS repeat-associated core domain-containing protein n=1 Tax=Aphanothece stagnina TaxID=1004305 RepID=UPI00398E88E3
MVTNALGSVVATYKDGWLTADRSYDPYGETRAEWNDVGRFGWVGGLGYRETRREWVSHYVRARHYGFTMGMWTSVDPLWPTEPAFGYVGGNPTNSVDPTGTVCIPKTRVTPCTKAEQKGVGQDQCDAKGRREGRILRSMKCWWVETTWTCYTCFGISYVHYKGLQGWCAEKPYGDCTPWRHKQLQDDVNKKCKGTGQPRRCDHTTMNCVQLRLNLARYAACIGARGRINRECYRGGDSGHVQAFEDNNVGFKRCKEELKQKKPPC